MCVCVCVCVCEQELALNIHKGWFAINQTKVNSSSSIEWSFQV